MSKKKKRHRRPTPAQPSVLLVSYVPLLCGQAGATYDLRKDADAIQAISERIGQCPSGKAECCLWMLDDQNRPGAVLALEQAAAIAGHLKEWAENQPAKWFKVYVKEREGKYAVVLFPEIRQSLSRFKFAHLLEGGDPIASGKVQVITNPLRFVSGPAPPTRPSRTGSARRSRWTGGSWPGRLAEPFRSRSRKDRLPGRVRGGRQPERWDGPLSGWTPRRGDGPPSHPSQLNPEARKKLGDPPC